MPPSLPASVRAALGDDGADDLVHWLDEYLRDRTVQRDEYREVLSRLDVLEERIVQLEERMDQRFEQVDQRFAQVEQRFEQIEQRFEQVDQRFEQIERRVEERFNQLDQRLDEQGGQLNSRIDRLHEAMRVQTRWTVGTIALFGTIVTVLLAIAEFAG